MNNNAMTGLFFALFGFVVLDRIINFSSDWVYSGDDCMSPEDIPVRFVPLSLAIPSRISGVTPIFSPTRFRSFLLIYVL